MDAMICKLHPKYKGILKPKQTTKHPYGCKVCNDIWREKQGLPKFYTPNKAEEEHLEKISKLSTDDIKQMMNEPIKRIAEIGQKQNEPPRDERTGTCRVCNGKVVARVTREYLGDIGHMIIGPGSRSQMTTIHHGLHCTKCGLKYEFPPPKFKERDDE